MSEYVVEACTIDSNTIKLLAESLKGLLTQANLVFDEEGVRMVTMNNGNTILVHLRLHASKFERYKCEKRTLIGFDTANFYTLLRSIRNRDTVTFYIARNNPNKLGILLENAVSRRITRYELSLLDIDEETVEIPDSRFPCILTVPSTELQQAIRDMRSLSKQVELKILGSTIVFSLKGSFSSQETILGETNDGLSFVQKPESAEIVQGVFSLDHLADIIKCSSMCSRAKIYMKIDFPLMVTYDVANLGEITFCLVPIESPGK